MMTGRHEWEGQSYHLRPDPYGRWIAAANYLTDVPGYEDAGDVADTLRQLASAAGDTGAASWDAVYDPVIDRLRVEVAEERRALFDLLAPRSDVVGAAGEASGVAERDVAVLAEELAEGLAAASRRIDPMIDPVEALASVERPVSILHGRRDHLIPFTEAFRLRAAMRDVQPHLNVTRLFGHSAQDPVPFMAGLTEVPRFAKALDRILRMV